MGQLHRRPAGGRAAHEGRLPDARRPVRPADLEGIEKILEAAGIETVYRETYTIDNANFDSIANAIKSRDADLVVNGATFEDGVGLVRSLLKVNFKPQWLYQTTAPSLGDQYSKGIGEENTEGIFYAVSHSQESDTPGNDEFVAKYQEMFGVRPGARGRGRRATRRRRSCRPPSRRSGSIDDQLALADWLRENEVDTILGPLSWNDDGQPDRRVPRRPVAERHAGDRAARGGRDRGGDRAGLAARFQVSHRPAE